MSDNKESDGINFDDFVIGDDFEETLNIAGEEKQPEEVKDEEETKETDDEVIDENQDGDDGEGDDDDDQIEEDDDSDEDESEEIEDDADGESEDEDSFVPLIEAIHQHNGWEFDAEAFEDGSINGLMDFIGEVVEANSKPEYASQESAKFDEFVRRYGPEKASEYLQANYGEMDYEKEDFSDDDSKKELMRNYLKETTKFSDAKIEKEVKKAEELGELDEEDTINEYKEHMVESAKERAKAVEERAEQERVRRYEDYQNYLSSQKNRIDSTEEISGHKLSKKEKDEFYKFTYEVGNDGKTGYQRIREEDKDLDLKLLWSAFRDSNQSGFKKKVESDVAKKVKKNLSRYTDKNSKKQSGVGRAEGKKTKSKDTNYNDFVLNR